MSNFVAYNVTYACMLSLSVAVVVLLSLRDICQYGIGFNTPSSASRLMLCGFDEISVKVSIQLDKNSLKVTERSHCLQNPLCTQTQHESPNVSGVFVWALCAHMEPLGYNCTPFFHSLLTKRKIGFLESDAPELPL